MLGCEPTKSVASCSSAITKLPAGLANGNGNASELAFFKLPWVAMGKNRIIIRNMK
jgi:hypothetical protein